ncbi:hypothetical protein [Cerasibacillus terrae]|uniref:hypothetical protein n=1 Tax=Cerasibacillus terrae TaxID=2498845 RepID=UPI001747D54B|nr:hypothetical protein [Cerasibacillus terrae]
MADQKRRNKKLHEEKKGIQTVKNQLIESYQSGVVEDQLENNRGVNTFNNQSN